MAPAVPTHRRARRAGRTLLIAGAAAALVGGGLQATASADTDPRIGLGSGYHDAQEAALNINKLASVPRPAGFDGPPGNFGFVNSDLAFSGDHAFIGNFNGFQIYDISDPAAPALRTTVVCPGGQGDVSVQGDLLYMSVEETRARTDCTTTAPASERFQGVRIFDISDLDAPRQIAAVQTCRGSHTHTLVDDPDQPGSTFVYVSGTAGVRPAETLAGCANTGPEDPNTSRWRIEVIEVPLDAPQDAAVVSNPRIFTDPATGAINGLQNSPPAPLHPSGEPWRPTPNTNTCHDITAFPEIGLAAGACQGNGILLDISDPVNPVRIDEVADGNFAYWHSATFNNDGTKVIFTDEWGGGTGARCRDTDQPAWGANALFDIVDGEMRFASYYKLPVPQTTAENCVAHNGNLLPVPGRDIMVQAWYQGGLSVFDFTDTANPTEIAYFDRGPLYESRLVTAGFWSTYYYNGVVVGTEIARGLDTFEFTPSAQLTENEIAAAAQVQFEEYNAQLQPMVDWDPSFAVAGARFDQADRADDLSPRLASRVQTALDRAEAFSERGNDRAAAALLRAAAGQVGSAAELAELRAALLDLEASLR